MNGFPYFIGTVNDTWTWEDLQNPQIWICTVITIELLWLLSVIINKMLPFIFKKFFTFLKKLWRPLQDDTDETT